MLDKALEAFSELGDDEELGPADWPSVKRYISCLNDIEGERVHPHGAPEKDSHLDPMNLKDIRVRLLNGKGTFTLTSVLKFFNFIVYSISLFVSFFTTEGTSSGLYLVFLFD